MSNERHTSELFQGLVISLAAAAMQHMGKTLHPVTQKIEKNLNAAQSTIDMIDMLEVKTRGNLDDMEEKLLKATLTELKLNFVDTLNDKPEAVEEKAEETPADAAAPAEDTPRDA